MAIVKWFGNAARYIITDFFLQIVSMAILFAAFVAWSYFDSVYAALTAIAIGFLLFAVIGAISKAKTKNTSP